MEDQHQGAPLHPGDPSATSTSSGASAPLTGKLRDEAGDRLTPTHTVKAGRRLRYYVSSRLTKGGADGGDHGGPSRSSGWRLPGPALEDAVAEALARHLDAAAQACTLLLQLKVADAAAVRERVRRLLIRLQPGTQVPTPVGQSGSLPRSGRSQGSHLHDRDGVLRALVRDGRLREGALHLALNPDALAVELGTSPAELSLSALHVTVPFSLRRRGVELRLIAGSALPTPDPKLIGALAKAHRWAAEMRQGASLAQIAAREATAESYISSRTRLAFLAPAIQTAIVNGTQPAHLTLERIVRGGVPLDWQEQTELFRFTA